MQSRIDLRERIRANSEPVTESGCWIWMKAVQSTYGHGKIKLRENGRIRQTTAHHASFEAFKGPVPTGMHVDHICRTPPCVNPDHLRILSPRENILIGVGRGAQNAKKTSCSRGHALSGDNVVEGFENGNPRRDCRECRNARRRSYDANPHRRARRHTAAYYRDYRARKKAQGGGQQ